MTAVNSLRILICSLRTNVPADGALAPQEPPDAGDGLAPRDHLSLST